MSYPAKKQTAEEHREYKRLAREEARAKALGRPVDSASMAIADLEQLPKVTAVPPLPVQAAQPAPAPCPRPSRHRQPHPPGGVVAADGYKFEVLDELPPSTRPSRIKNPGRAAVSAAARTHAGKWIPYPPTAEDPYKSSSTTAQQAREGKAGFGPGLEAAVRQKQLYISYVGEGQ